jgi:hypothetical protein
MAHIVKTLLHGNNFEQLSNREFPTEDKARECAVLDWGLHYDQFQVVEVEQMSETRYPVSPVRQNKEVLL